MSSEATRRYVIPSAAATSMSTQSSAKALEARRARKAVNRVLEASNAAVHAAL